MIVGFLHKTHITRSYERMEKSEGKRRRKAVLKD
jgi:hypothetical protein